MALESLADLQTFRRGIAERHSLPRIRIAMRMPDQPEAEQREHERQINRLLSAQGWTEAAVGACVLLGLTLIVPLSPAGRESATALSAWAAQGLLSVLVGARVGKLAGQWAVLPRLRRLCARIEGQIKP